MKRYIRAASSQLSNEELENLKKRVKDEDLFAICYGIIWPKRAKDFPGRVDFNPDGILFANNYAEYRRQVTEIVTNSGSAESSFKFYTVYNKKASGEIPGSHPSLLPGGICYKRNIADPGQKRSHGPIGPAARARAAKENFEGGIRL